MNLEQETNRQKGEQTLQRRISNNNYYMITYKNTRFLSFFLFIFVAFWKNGIRAKEQRRKYGTLVRSVV